ncbi:MAG: Mut7-C RNAse domain-containing protein [Syntrophaceae bacterium]
MKVKFITDINLGKLLKWLRILGYDTVVYTHNANREFLRKAEKEERVVLTRKKDMATRQFSGCLVIINSDYVMDQLNEVMDKLSLSPDEERIFTICVKCNEQLMKAEKQEISGMVPEHILSNHSDFHICKRCNAVFWPGTHRDNVQNYLRTHIRRHHP